MPTLLIAEHDNKSLKDATSKALTAAKAIGADVHVLVAGNGCKPVAEAAAKLDGVKKVLLAEAPAYEHMLAEPLAALIVSRAGPYEAIVAPATTSGKNFMPRVAALLDVMQISDVIKVDGPDTFERPIYAGNAIQTVRALDPKKVITVRTAAFQAAGQGGSAPVETVAAAADPGLSQFTGEELSKSERPELTSAKIIISGGRAMQSRENFTKYIEPVADKLGAAVGASRAAVDAGYAPNDWQVGQTGKVVAPDLYIAVGISGAIQHLAGMKDSKVIVAINKDEEAPIFQVADYGLVADLYQALPELASRTRQGARLTTRRIFGAPRRGTARQIVVEEDDMNEVKERPVARSGRTEHTPHAIRKIGVVGAGQMGNGIAHVCALAGFHVLLNDIAPDRITEGLATINGNLARQVSRQRISEEQRDAAIKRISAAKSVDELGDCDLVIEAATEKEDVKRKIFGGLCPSLKPEAIVGTNTSSISITRLAAATDRPERFIGIHFMNPVPLMELVEVIRGIATDDAHLRRDQTIHRQAPQDDRSVGGFSCLHRQPHPAANDQRGDLYAL